MSGCRLGLGDRQGGVGEHDVRIAQRNETSDKIRYVRGDKEETLFVLLYLRSGFATQGKCVFTETCGLRMGYYCKHFLVLWEHCLNRLVLLGACNYTRVLLCSLMEATAIGNF